MNMEAYELTDKKFHPEPTVVRVGRHEIGPGTLTIMAGPCAIESREQLMKTAESVRTAGAVLVRGGAYKPRTSPYSFQGLEEEGLIYMKELREATGCAVVCEVTSTSTIEKAVQYVDMLQIGARNMQNFELLKELGHTGKPILIKRGLANTLQELLMSAEYVMAGGNDKVILCERGIRTFETATRNTLDLSAVPMLKKLTHLPVIIDPSHATGIAWMVKPMALAATACGADGLMIEVHNNPKNALCDGAQSLTPEAFDDVMQAVNAILPHAFKMPKEV